MKFDEQFPSLKDKVMIWDTENPFFDDIIDVVDVTYIQRHCLDKQKVREIIEKVRNSVDQRVGPCYSDEVLDAVLKELKL